MRHEHSHIRPDREGGSAGFLSLDRFSLHALWHAIGRGHHGHHGPRGGGPFGGGFDFGSGDGHMPRGRKFTSDDLQLLLLALLVLDTARVLFVGSAIYMVSGPVWTVWGLAAHRRRMRRNPA